MLVFLLGYMGSGKSTTGEKLASRLGYNFIDLDNEIEKKNNKNISLLFKEEGEEYFRNTEKATLQTSFHLKDTVIACGGGTPCFYDNLEQMNTNGLTVYLKLAPGSLFHRLAAGKSRRPLLAHLPDLVLMEFIISELDKRRFYYEKADVIFKGENLKLDELAEAIKKAGKIKGLV